MAPREGEFALVGYAGNDVESIWPQHVSWIREATIKEPPLFSMILVRWGKIEEACMEEEDGGWGRYGSSVSNEYMSGLVKTVFFTSKSRL